MAHYAGDEILSNEEPAQIINFAGPDLTANQLEQILLTFWTNPNTKDNTVTINVANRNAN